MKIIKIIVAFCCLFSVFNNSVAQENVIPDGRRWIYREYRPLYPPPMAIESPISMQRAIQ